jgi:hypothetical protein
MTVKIVFGILAALGFTMSLFFLLNGEPMLSGFTILQVLMLILSGAVYDLRIRIKRIEDYFSQWPYLREGEGQNRE